MRWCPIIVVSSLLGAILAVNIAILVVLIAR